MNFKKIVGRNIKNMRLQARFTQTDVATRANITQTTVSYLERCQFSPRIHTIEKLANVYNCEPEDFFDPKVLKVKSLNTGKRRVRVKM